MSGEGGWKSKGQYANVQICKCANVQMGEWENEVEKAVIVGSYAQVTVTPSLLWATVYLSGLWLL
jgi:hypothetical protein